MASPPTDSFTERALQIYEDAKNEIGYIAHRFRQKVKNDGGLAAAKQWLRPSATTAGFRRLLDHDRLDLSVEAVALEDPWNALFTPEELQTARERLARFGYFTRTTTSAVPSTQLSAEELPQDLQYPEGAAKQLLVNAYERDPKARAKCIQHYGLNCYVCNLDFLEVYGELGRDFIHVHHLTPFGTSGNRRLTDAIADLRPVCPNCHAMLHRRNPPVPIAELKQRIHLTNR